MGITQVSTVVIEDGSITKDKLDLSSGVSTAGQVLAIDGSNNFYFTDRFVSEEVDDRVADLINGGSHSNISIIYDDAANTLSFSATGAVSSVNGQTGIIVLDTDDISEGTTNLYYTDARARSAISVTGDLAYNSSTGVLSVTTYKTSNFNTDFSAKTTTDLTEGTNLYFTNSRAQSAISVTDSGGDGSLSYNSGTGVITYTGPSAVEVRAHFSAGTGVGIINGQISIGQDVSTTSNVIFNDISATGNIQVDGNLTVSGTTTTINATNLSISDNMIYLNDGSTTANPDLGISANYNDGTYAHTGIFRDATDGIWKIFDQYVPEPDASVYIDTGHPTFNLADFQAGTIYAELTGNVTGNVSGTVTGTVSTLSNHSTSNLTEGTNLYFTDERVDDRISSLLVAGSNITLTYNDVANALTISANNTGGYDLSNNTTTDLTEGTNLYYTDVRARSAISATGDLTYTPATGVLSVTTYKTSDFNTDFSAKTTTDLTEGTNLYFTTERAQDAIGSLLVAGTNISLNYNDTANTLTITANGLSGSTTDNLVEGTTNLYFTDERVDDRIANLLVAGSNITLTYDDVANTLTVAANNTGGYDLSNNTTTDLAEGTNLYYTDSRARASISVNDASNTVTYNPTTGVVSVSVIDPQSIRAAFTATDGISYDELNGVYTLDTLYSPTFADMILTGNLTVQGTTTTVNTEQLLIADNIITLNSDVSGTPTENAGIEVNRGSLTSVGIRWNETVDAWQFSNDGITYQNIGSLSASTTDDLAEGVTNLYFTDERAQDALGNIILGGNNITFTYDDASNTMTFDSDISSTTDLPEGTNLYYTDARWDAKMALADADNLSEGLTNLYYTQSRADARVDVLRTELLSDSTGAVHFNNLTNVPTVTTQILIGTGVATYTLSNAPGSPAGIIVTLNGVTQEPTTDYTVSGTSITFSSALPNGQKALIRYVGYQISGGTIISATDSNLLDGLDSTQFLRSDADDTMVGNLTMTGNIFPSANVTYSLGSDTNRWNELWLSSSTINIGNNALSATANNKPLWNTTEFVLSNVTTDLIPETDNTYNLGSQTKQFASVYGHAIEATYADLAERYEIDSEYEVGSVVVFGGEKEITLCNRSADVSVAGVISTNPAFKMNSIAGSDITHPYVALRGRVPCKAIGPVRKGDLMVTSSELGVAKSVGKTDMGCAVFAKSLVDDLSDGIKLIEVVIV